MPRVKRAPLDFGNDPPRAPARACDSPDCAGEGLHRAPRSHNDLTSYYWFCLEHVRRYNAEWDFFAGMNQGEIDAFRRDDVTGHRPTWPLGGRRRLGGTWDRVGWRDLFALLGGTDGPETQRRCSPRLAGERDALATMDLGRAATQTDIKTRFKHLVKRHHPDANGGDKKGEERLKVIINAYRLLVRRRSA